MEQTVPLYLTKAEGKMTPCSNLDCILATKPITYKYLDPYDGLDITEETFPNVIRTARNQHVSKVYKTTDHSIILIEYEVDNKKINVLFFSLDSSVRANENGFPLYSRVDNLIELINKIIARLGGDCLLFFSEACRPSFLGPMNNRENIVSWTTIKDQIISGVKGLESVGDYPNNSNEMSFGIAVFSLGVKVTDVFVENLMQKDNKPIGFGCSCVGIQLVDGSIIWGTHFPIDFKGIKEESNSYIVMARLVEVIKSYKSTIFAFGDFNMIPGNMEEAIILAFKTLKTEDMNLIRSQFISFFPAYFDTIPDEVDRISVFEHYCVDL